MQKITSLFLSVWLISTACAADSLQLSQVLQRIRKLQIQHTTNDFPAGIFPSYREYNGRNIMRSDDNAFFTGLVVLTLQNLRSYLSPADLLVCDSISSEAAAIYPLFRNKTGRSTYNFWRTNPPVVFPNGGWLNWMNRSHALPDDIDDTAILLMVMNAPDSTVAGIHALMQHHTNTGKKRKKTRYKDYRDIPAYSTWFGKRFPTDLDMCVLSNALYMLQRYHQPFTAADSASLRFITTAIDNGHYMDKPSYVSPHYARTPIILYHLSRLMQAGTLSALEQRRPALIAETQKQFAAAANPMDKILLAISLLRWKQPVPALEWHTDTDVFSYLEQNDFSFFIANMASILTDPIRQWVSDTGLGRFYYYCPAYNNALLLEYLALQQQAGK
ncbi:hypothetical protein [Filimonas lacunae]|uniref:hypothetical protein n=1 Tax=Filimonas lacunae TaxID=477680 RepID=UPI0011847122|nr:hypothetical protein [Filimonas lacunae]